MGNCASSKYAVDEDKAPKKQKLTKKQKKELEANGGAIEDVPAAEAGAEAGEVKAEVPESTKEEDKIDFIDETNQEGKVESTETVESKSDENQKKEVTTYQTTVVKHTQKEGDELLEHLRCEAFRTLQNLLKKQETGNGENAVTKTVTSTTVTANNTVPETAETSDNDDIVEQIKAQAITSLGNTQQEKIYAIVDFGTDQIRCGSVGTMNELSDSLEKQFPEDKNLVSKVVNSTTGFLTAKGTEAGSLLSNILANVSGGLQGVMNETEKTTVKVTRTVTEHVMSGGELKEVTRVITSPMEAAGAPGVPSNNIEDVLKNLQNGLSVDGTSFTATTVSGVPEITRTTITNSGTTESSTAHSEKHEHVVQSSVSEVTNADESVTRSQAEEVVSSAVNAAVEKVSSESRERGEVVQQKTSSSTEESSQMQHHVTEENIKIEEESSIKTTTTKVTLNGEESVSSQIEKAQNEFYKHGKQSAEESISKLTVNGEETVTSQTASESKSETQEQASFNTSEVVVA